MEDEPVTRYSRLGQGIHWSMAILILIAFIYGPGGPEKHIYSASRAFDRQFHETLGIVIVVLTLLRVTWRATAAIPPESPAAPRWMVWAGRAAHHTMYLLLFALPVSAVAGAWLEGHPLTLLGGIRIAPLFPKSHDLGAAITEVHSWLGDAILWLAGIHAVAGLYHHIVLKDEVLASMVPRWLLGRSRT